MPILREIKDFSPATMMEVFRRIVGSGSLPMDRVTTLISMM